MLLTGLCVFLGLICFVIFAPAILGLFGESLVVGCLIIGVVIDWIEQKLKELNTQLVWALAGCSVLGAVVLLAYLLRR